MKLGTRIRCLRDGWRGPLPHPQRWVFIVGCYNSGTTLLHEILATHPAVGSMPSEGQFYTDELPLPKDFGLARLWALEPDRFRLREGEGGGVNVDRIKRQWGARFNDPRRPVLLEKSPTNAGRTRWLQEHFENAHFIGIIRNGYAVAEGIRRKAGHELSRAARQWKTSNSVMLQDFPHLRRGLLLRYEELAEDPAARLAEVAEFVGLDVADLPLDARSWRIHGESAPVRNMDARALARLDAYDRVVVEQEAGELLDRLGYGAPAPDPAVA